MDKGEEKLNAIIDKQDKRLNDLQSSAFSLANSYFVFQGVILTIVCNGAQNLKPSNRWFLLTLSILAALVNLSAFIQIGMKYIDTKAWREEFRSKLNDSQPDHPDKEANPSDEKAKKSKQDEKSKQLKIYINKIKHEHYLYLAIYIIIFLGFAAVVLVGCWKFLGNQNE